MILESFIKPKKFFDVSNRQHVEMYKNFLASYKWGNDGCPFILEFPYLTIPDMIKDKLMYKFLKMENPNV